MVQLKVFRFGSRCFGSNLFRIEGVLVFGRICFGSKVSVQMLLGLFGLGMEVTLFVCSGRKEEYCKVKYMVSLLCLTEMQIV